MDDIVEQLRTHARPPYDAGCHGGVMDKAADEIERLRDGITSLADHEPLDLLRPHEIQRKLRALLSLKGDSDA